MSHVPWHQEEAPRIAWSCDNGLSWFPAVSPLPFSLVVVVVTAVRGGGGAGQQAFLVRGARIAARCGPEPDPNAAFDTL